MKHWNKRQFDRLLSIGALIIVAIFMYYTKDIVAPAHIYPRCILIAMAVLAVILMLMTFKEDKEDSQAVKPFATVNNKRVWTIIISTAIYLVATVTIGFYVSTFIYLLVLMLGFSEKRTTKTVVSVVLTSFVVTAIIFAGFWTFLQVPTPVGLLM